MSRVVKNYLYSLMFQLVTLLVPIVLSPFLARVLGARNIGIYAYVFTVTNVISTLALVGTYSYGCREIAYVRDNKSLTKETYNEIFSLRIALGIVGTIFYFIYAILDNKYILIFTFYYLDFLAKIIDPSWFFVGQEKMKPVVIKNICIKIFSMLLVLITVKDEKDLWIYALIMGSFSFIGNMSIYSKLNEYGINHKITFKKYKTHLKQSILLFLPQVATMMYMQVDKIMIKFLGGDIIQLSYYDYGEKIINIPLTFVTVLSTVMMPKIANEYRNNNNDNIKELLFKAFNFSMMLASPMMIGIILVANNLIPWYLGESYLPSISVIVIIAPMIISSTITSIAGNQYFVATSQTNILLKSNIIAGIANMVINASLIPKFGCDGAAIATLMSSFACSIVQLYYINKDFKILNILKFIKRYIILCIPMAIPVYIIGQFNKGSIKTTIIQVITGAFIYILTLLISRDKNLDYLFYKIKNIISGISLKYSS